LKDTDAATIQQSQPQNAGAEGQSRGDILFWSDEKNGATTP